MGEQRLGSSLAPREAEIAEECPSLADPAYAAQCQALQEMLDQVGKGGEGRDLNIARATRTLIE